MKKMIAAVAVAACVFAPQAFAQAKNFEGFSVGVNADWVNATSGYTSTSGAVTESVSDSSLNLGIQAQYNIAMGQQFVLGLGAMYELTKSKAGTYASGTAIKAKNNYTVFIAPGYAISNTTLIYGKVSSIGTTSECEGCTDTTFSGYGVGVGFQSLLDKNWYLQGEAMANKYDDKVGNGATNNAKTTILSFGVGYKF